MAVWSRFQVPALVRAGFRVITVENRGNEPDSATTPSTVIADYVDDTAAFVNVLDLAPCWLVGASLGAMIPKEMALAHPTLVRRAPLAGTRCRTVFFRAK